METRPYVQWELINDFMVDVFKAYGVPEEDAKICADVLLESDRRGIESHVCNRHGGLPQDDGKAHREGQNLRHGRRHHF